MVIDWDGGANTSKCWTYTDKQCCTVVEVDDDVAESCTKIQPTKKSVFQRRQNKCILSHNEMYAHPAILSLSILSYLPSDESLSCPVMTTWLSAPPVDGITGNHRYRSLSYT
jgi:hypothetical protein